MSMEGFADNAGFSPETATFVVEPVSSPEHTINPLHEGAEWLLDRGVGYDVAGIQLVGPNEACRGTLAEMVGMPGHSGMRDNVERMINAATATGKDPAEAVTAGIVFFARRDDNGGILRVSPDELKKN